MGGPADRLPLPKSVTTAIARASRSCGGIQGSPRGQRLVSLCGMCSLFAKWFHITDPVVGAAIGACSHAPGTKALDGELQAP